MMDDPTVDAAMLTTDCHFPPPPSLTQELPERFRRHFLRVEERDDGVYLVRPTFRPQMASGAADYTPNPTTMLLNDGVKLDDPDDEAMLARLVQGDVAPEARPSFHLADLRTELERDGVAGGVLISSFGLPSGELEADIAWCQLVNDWMAEECAGELHRFAPGIQLPLGSVAASVKELERAAGLGLRPALLPDVFPARHWLDPDWEPLWEALEGLDVPVTMHVSDARAGLPWTMATAFQPGIGATAGFVLVSGGMAESALWFSGGGILERHPGLRVVFTECSAGWFAWAMNFFDYHYFGRFGNNFVTEMGMPSTKLCEFPPSHYLRRQTACTFMDDPVAVHNIELTGVESLMWGNDWPHQEGSHPRSIEAVTKQFDGVPEAQARAVVHDNAARVFRLTV
jgi:predicted TIM-barrel fold metal-dependent hydrolase